MGKGKFTVSIVNVIALEKRKSNFQLYITDFIGEIDCISIRESLVAGCIHLISNSGVFNKRDGLHFDIGSKTQENFAKIASILLNLLKKPEFLEIARQKFILNTWEQTADCWLNNF